MDLVLVIPCLIALSPLMLLIALAVKVTSPGKVVYRRRVLGCGGYEFDAFKFRTMIANADDYLRQHHDLWVQYQENIKLKNDPRITPLGHWLRKASLDELPQLINVLLGQMSLVGPRMISPEERDKYGSYAEKRLSVRPGVTGLWQVSGRQDVDYQQRIVLDMKYIDEWSIWLDLKILLKTFFVVLSSRGAY